MQCGSLDDKKISETLPASRHSCPSCSECGVRMVQSECQLGSDNDAPKPWYCPNCGTYTDQPVWDWLLKVVDRWNREEHERASLVTVPLQ